MRGLISFSFLLVDTSVRDREKVTLLAKYIHIFLSYLIYFRSKAFHRKPYLRKTLGAGTVAPLM